MRRLRPAGVALLGALFAAAAPAAAQSPTPELESIAGMIQAGRLEAAESGLRELLAGRDDPLARDLLGVVLGRQGRSREAEEQFRQAIAAAPEALGPRQHLARLYLIQDRREEAAAELRDAARLGPLERDLGLALAAVESQRGDDAAAAAELRAVADNHESVRALVELARLESARGERDAALTSLRRALVIAPNSEEVLRAHAEVALAAGAPIATVWSLEPLTRMHPDVVEYPYLLGVARLQVGDSSGAAEAFERALELEPRRALTLVGLGLAYNNQRRYADAVDALTRALRLEPESAEAVAALAQAEEGLGRLEDAERHANRALARAPDHSLAHEVIGLVRMKQGRYEEARESLQRALAINPNSVKAHYQLSLAFARLGDRESSQRHLELYRQALKRVEAALIELATRTGASLDPM